MLLQLLDRESTKHMILPSDPLISWGKGPSTRRLGSTQADVRYFGYKASDSLELLKYISSTAQAQQQKEVPCVHRSTRATGAPGETTTQGGPITGVVSNEAMGEYYKWLRNTKGGTPVHLASNLEAKENPHPFDV